ncbi:MAG: DUF2236 domain-containing protein [Pseudomonadales bacterium]|nr:DUF2236 domain-containing protein [Pseudomonadales bacterium]
MHRLNRSDRLEQWINDPTQAETSMDNEGDHQNTSVAPLSKSAVAMYPKSAVAMYPKSAVAMYPKPAVAMYPKPAVPMHHPESLYLRYGADIRNALLMGGSTFVMQVAHPKVGAGVGDLSNFKKDPWHRLREIGKSGQAYIFSGKAAGLKEGQRLRELHRNIKGVDKNGDAYHSLNPKVYGWVHMVFLDRMITMHRLYGTPLPRHKQEVLFQQWHEGGRVFGLRDQDMPHNIDDYYQYFNEMIEESLEYNHVMDYMLSLDRQPPPKPYAAIPDFAWRSLWKKTGKQYREVILFSLPENYRRKISQHQPWSDADQQRMRRFARRFYWFYRRLPYRYRYERRAWKAMGLQ